MPECSNNSVWALMDRVLKLSSSLGGAKNYCYQQYFVPLEINKVLFHSRTIVFILHQ
jgi:hypothetical protein